MKKPWVLGILLSSTLISAHAGLFVQKSLEVTLLKVEQAFQSHQRVLREDLQQQDLPLTMMDLFKHRPFGPPAIIDDWNISLIPGDQAIKVCAKVPTAKTVARVSAISTFRKYKYELSDASCQQHILGAYLSNDNTSVYAIKTFRADQVPSATILAKYPVLAEPITESNLKPALAFKLAGDASSDEQTLTVVNPAPQSFEFNEQGALIEIFDFSYPKVLKPEDVVPGLVTGIDSIQITHGWQAEHSCDVIKPQNSCVITLSYKGIPSVSKQFGAAVITFKTGAKSRVTLRGTVTK